MESKTSKLRIHHDSIADWIDEGLSLRVIAERLKIEGIEVDHNAVRRYCKKAGLSTKKKSPPAIKEIIPEPEIDKHQSYQSEFESISSEVCSPFESVEITSEIVVSPPPEKLPWQPPQRLYTPLDIGPWWGFTPSDCYIWLRR